MELTGEARVARVGELVYVAWQGIDNCGKPFARVDAVRLQEVSLVGNHGRMQTVVREADGSVRALYEFERVFETEREAREGAADALYQIAAEINRFGSAFVAGKE